MASAASNYNKTLVQIQKLANTSAKTIQNMINKSNKEQMTFNSAEAQKSRDWQEKMSKTAHQMEVKDLKAAGLNPVLSTGGSGAQSYTTSSASTQNDSGSSATAAILSDELGAMSNMESARMNADASLKASERQAKATRYAAQQSAQAQMYAAKYAADQSYALGKYKADLQYQSDQEERANKRWLLKNTPASNGASFLDKYLRDTGLNQKGISAWKSILFGKKNSFGTSAFSGGKKLKQYVKKYGTPSKWGDYNIPKAGSNLDKRMTLALNAMGVKPNSNSKDLLWRAVVFRDHTSLKYLASYVDHTNPFSVRYGHR